MCVCVCVCVCVFVCMCVCPCVYVRMCVGPLRTWPNSFDETATTRAWRCGVSVTKSLVSHLASTRTHPNRKLVRCECGNPNPKTYTLNPNLNTKP